MTDLLRDLLHHQAWADAVHWHVPVVDLIVWYWKGRPGPRWP